MTNYFARPRIGITIGDPAGIGPEIVLKAAAAPAVLQACIPIIIGDAQYLTHWAKIFSPHTQFFSTDEANALATATEFPLIFDCKNLPAQINLGQEQASAGRAAGQYIETAVQLCLDHKIAALATAPINKKSLHLGGYNFLGHTEMLAALTNTTDFAMSFFAPNLRTALLTTHLALADISAQVKQAPLVKLIRLVNRELIRFGIVAPRIALAALNPHGSEGGLFGNEEALEMTPAVAFCQQQDGINVTGPHSGDTIFVRAAKGEFDLVISCYHDQGLIPIKCFSFGEAVNVTLGLPFIRTSVDHGTAFDIAGQNKADFSSMITAITLAAELATKSAR